MWNQAAGVYIWPTRPNFYIRPYVSMHMGLPEAGLVEFKNTYVKVGTDGRLHVLFAAPDASWQVVTATLMPQLKTQMLVWAKATDLDGFVLLPAGLNVWKLHGWQCKGRYHAVQITGCALATSEKTFERDGRFGAVDDGTWHWIVLKAQVATCKLMQACVGTTITLVPASLTITTTKDARLAHDALTKLENVMTIAQSTAERSGLASRYWRVTCIVASFRFGCAMVAALLAKFATRCGHVDGCNSYSDSDRFTIGTYDRTFTDKCMHHSMKSWPPVAVP
jgi:hypothetical protein